MLAARLFLDPMLRIRGGTPPLPICTGGVMITEQRDNKFTFQVFVAANKITLLMYLSVRYVRLS